MKQIKQFKTITIRYKTWENLLILRPKLNARSHDEIIRRVLKKFEEEMK